MSHVRDFGAAGNGADDDTQALQHAIDSGDGAVELPRGEYLIRKTLRVDLAKVGRTSISGAGGTAKIVMAGAGPAIFLQGTHDKTADPAGFRPDVWRSERMPILSSLEIEGRHPEADGVRIVGVMQPTLAGLLIREVRTAVHVTDRARNLIVTHCHFYHNTGVGLHLDGVNLHQAIVANSHISYCRLGGVRIENSEIRNLQITGNDIEYNNNRSHKVTGEDSGADEVPTAEIYIDVAGGSVREGTIASNTLQATYSPGGANLRIVGRGPDANHKAGMWAITGNLIGSQENNVHLTSARGVTLTGNYLYSGHHRNLLVEHCRNIVASGNCFGHNPDYGDKDLCTGVRLEDSEDCVLSGNLIQDCRTGKHTVAGAPKLRRQGLLEVVRCRRVNLSGAQIVDGAPCGVYLQECSDTLLTGCTILDSRDVPLMEAAIVWTGQGYGNQVSSCRLGASGVRHAPESGVTLANNL